MMMLPTKLSIGHSAFLEEEGRGRQGRMGLLARKSVAYPHTQERFNKWSRPNSPWAKPHTQISDTPIKKGAFFWKITSRIRQPLACVRGIGKTPTPSFVPASAHCLKSVCFPRDDRASSSNERVRPQAAEVCSSGSSLRTRMERLLARPRVPGALHSRQG